MFNSEFNEFAATPEQAALDLYPAAKRAEIDELNQYVYNKLNNGVYKAGTSLFLVFFCLTLQQDSPEVRVLTTRLFLECLKRWMFWK
jgi:hypothetical protein